MFHSKIVARQTITAFTGIAGSLLFTGVAQAQSAGADSIESVIVTGSRIARDGYNTPTPVSVLSSDEIQAEAPGSVAGAKVQAMNLFDLFTDEQLLEDAWEYYNQVQTKDMQYTPLLRPEDQPAIHLNEGIMATFRPIMDDYYYDPSQFDTYMDQLGIDYPTVRVD